MHLGLIIETADPEQVSNAFRLANTALADGHSVSAFFLGDGVESPDVSSKQYSPFDAIREFQTAGGELYACEVCMGARDMEPDVLRPPSPMSDLSDMVERTDETLTIG